LPGGKLFLQFTRDLFDVDRYAAEITSWVLALNVVGRLDLA